MVYYNENNDFAAAWLRNLITAGLIAKGDVDERSIEEVCSDDLRNYSQCHFFAGIGVWSYALRQSGWPDDRPVWTGSCPCQPFSAAGKGEGFSDPRHLWPYWFRLVRESRPVTIFGEQVDKALNWLDLVSGELESEGYTVGTAIMGAHSVGAPHIRQRLYFVADSPESRRQEEGEYDGGPSPLSARSAECSGTRVAQGDADNPRSQGRRLPQPDRGGNSSSELASRSPSTSDGVARAARATRIGTERCNDSRIDSGGCSEVNALGNPECERDENDGRGTSSGTAAGMQGPSEEREWIRTDSRQPMHAISGRLGITDSARSFSGNETSKTTRYWNPSITAGFWSAADWLPCLDGKTRPVEPGTFPLAHGSPNRVGRLRGYGNAIVVPQAQAFIEAYIECCP